MVRYQQVGGAEYDYASYKMAKHTSMKSMHNGVYEAVYDSLCKGTHECMCASMSACGGVQCDSVWCGAVRCGSVRCGAVWCGPVQRGAAQ